VGIQETVHSKKINRWLPVFTQHSTTTNAIDKKCTSASLSDLYLNVTDNESLCDHWLEASSTLIQLYLSNGVMDEVAIMAIIRVWPTFHVK
jgi:hypothetical protein